MKSSAEITVIAKTVGNFVNGFFSEYVQGGRSSFLQDLMITCQKMAVYR
jgi:hypothetical protein